MFVALLGDLYFALFVVRVACTDLWVWFSGSFGCVLVLGLGLAVVLRLFLLMWR